MLSVLIAIAVVMTYSLIIRCFCSSVMQKLINLLGGVKTKFRVTQDIFN